MFELEINGVTSKLDVTRVRGTEGMSKPFAFDVDVRSRRSTLTDHVGDEVTLTLRVDGVESVRHGTIDRITALGADGATVLYRVHVVPALATLELRSNCRIFQEMTVEEVITELLHEHDIDAFDVATTGSRSPRPYLVQYRETDLQFVERLIAEEGLFYFFEHRADRHTMVLADESDGYRGLPGGSPSLGFDVTASEPDRVSRFEVSAGRVVDAVTLRDDNPLDPSLDLEVTAKTPRSAGTDEVYEYPGGYTDRSDGEQRAAWRLAAQRLAVPSAAATTNSPRVTPGHVFELTDHPLRAANARWVVVDVVHDAEQDPRSGRLLRYENAMACLAETEVHRTTGRSPRLTMRGPQTAIVVGPAGEEIHVDEQGRVKVQFRWDRDGGFDEHSSAWIRVAQASSGNGWGTMVIPRVGQEVLVDFVDGDPDRPIIVGSPYNGTDRPHYDLPEHKNRTVFRSRTTPGGGAHHELVFDDTAGSEFVRCVSAGDLVSQTATDSETSIGADETITVGGNRTIGVGSNESHSIADHETRAVGRDRTTEVGRDDSLGVGRDLTIDVAGDEVHSVGSGLTLEVGGDVAQAIRKSFTCDAGSVAELRARTIVLRASNDIRFEVGDSRIVMKKDGSIAITGQKIQVEASRNLRIKGPDTR